MVRFLSTFWELKCLGTSLAAVTSGSHGSQVRGPEFPGSVAFKIEKIEFKGFPKGHQMEDSRNILVDWISPFDQFQSNFFPFRFNYSKKTISTETLSIVPCTIASFTRSLHACVLFAPLLWLTLTKSTASWLSNTSQRPSQASMRNSSSGVKSNSIISGSASTKSSLSQVSLIGAWSTVVNFWVKHSNVSKNVQISFLDVITIPEFPVPVFIFQIPFVFSVSDCPSHR